MRDAEEKDLAAFLNCIFHAKVQLAAVKAARASRGADVADVERTRAVLAEIEAAYTKVHARRCCEVVVKEL